MIHPSAVEDLLISPQPLLRFGTATLAQPFFRPEDGTDYHPKGGHQPQGLNVPPGIIFAKEVVGALPVYDQHTRQNALTTLSLEVHHLRLWREKNLPAGFLSR